MFNSPSDWQIIHQVIDHKQAAHIPSKFVCVAINHIFKSASIAQFHKLLATFFQHSAIAFSHLEKGSLLAAVEILIIKMTHISY